MFNLKVDEELELRILSQDLDQTIFDVATENYDYLHRWVIWMNENTNLESIQIFLKTCERNFQANKAKDFGIYWQSDFAGIVSLVNISQQNKSAEIGYWIAEKFGGHGIVTKSCKALLAYAFNELKLNSVRILCASGNLKSRAIPERLGFTQEGIEREAGWLHTRFVDHVVYSMLAKEWGEKV
jgi:ribosomal-protein-serine acetyltransferase